MCELFAMSSSIPTEVSFSLDEFSKHGGLTDQHKDGWGIAYYDENDVRIIKEACPAVESDYLRFIKEHSLRSNIIISHIRLATQGEISIRNTQPFSRELGGRQHVFAHNGDLAKLQNIKLTRFKPVGNTDSEIAFCFLMEKMAVLWKGDSPPTLHERHQVIKTFANKLRSKGIANFIYSDSEYVFIHSHKRISSNTKKAQLPGLFILCRRCQKGANKQKKVINGLQLTGTKSQKVVLVASVPLSDENWSALQEGEIRVIKNGEIISDC